MQLFIWTESLDCGTRGYGSAGVIAADLESARQLLDELFEQELAERKADPYYREYGENLPQYCHPLDWATPAAEHAPDHIVEVAPSEAARVLFTEAGWDD